MNKKRLSVVMAGAMLASSVAPVLAAEVTKDETTHGKIGLFIDKLEKLMDTKKYHITDAEAGKSVYRFAVLRADGSVIDTFGTSSQKNSYTLKGSKEPITLYNDANILKELTKDTRPERVYTVKVYELGSVERNGGLFSTDKSSATKLKWDTETFPKLVKDVKEYNESKSTNNIKEYPGLKTAIDNGWITKLELTNNDSNVIVTLGSKDADGEYNKLTCAIGTDKYVFANPVDKDGNLLGDSLGNDTIQGLIAGFRVDEKQPATTPNESIAGKKAVLLHEVKVLNGDMNYTVKVDELYDGFMLTDKGHELMNAVRKYDNEAFAPNVAYDKTGAFAEKGTERSFTITFVDENGTKHVVKIVGDSLHLAKIKTLKKWYQNGKADVELLAGSNRYATAVEIAKTYIARQYAAGKTEINGTNELVLINGKALVDGLAAAPYARQQSAPILLTATDSLPKETKAYMKELLSKYHIGDLNNKKINVTIVGGEAVVSQNVVNELKELGFKVKRISGDNREETSLAVADKLKGTANAKTQAFVVGAEGEADAMSIASYAAYKKAPIIVSKSVKGLSTVGVNEVSEYTNVEIVGGEGVVPASTETEIKELVADEKKVTRINGKNRFETNALVIKKYHKGFKDALIAKDGKRNKEELVDALPASLFASAFYGVNNGDSARVPAPIVLATDKISEEQLNQLVLNADKSAARTVYQIGIGVNPETVMQVVVKKLGLNR